MTEVISPISGVKSSSIGYDPSRKRKLIFTSESESSSKKKIRLGHNLFNIGNEAINSITHANSVAHDQAQLTCDVSKAKDQAQLTSRIPNTQDQVKGNNSTSTRAEGTLVRWPYPRWRRPWKQYGVISDHSGSVRSIAFHPSNSWFYTASADGTIKIWDVGSGMLKFTLAAHTGQVRGLAVSTRHTHMFSVGDDKLVKCWDVERNEVIRTFRGHLSEVFCLAMHTTDDVLFTGGSDSLCRVWDIRSKTQVCALSGHENTVCSVFTRPMDPQVVTGSYDTSIKLWDLRKGSAMTTLTHHKESVRALAPHPKEDAFASGSADNITKFKLPRGDFMHNMLYHLNTSINAIAINRKGVVVTGGDSGCIWFWDWKTGHNFQQRQTIVQPGSLESETGIDAMSFDITGKMLVTCEADRTIKMWKEDELSHPLLHPVHFMPPTYEMVFQV